MKAAVMHERAKPLVVEELELDAPHAGEVSVRLVATGVCHSDLNGLRSSRPLKLPMVLGHEGAGIVEAVGPGVTSVKPGDHVVLPSIARCGRCASCVSGRPWLCNAAAATMFGGTLLDGTTRLRRGDEPVYHWFAQSSFAERAVVPEGSTVRVPDDVPLDKVAVLACGVSTGLGAVLNAARVRVGESVAVIGCGGVGVSAIIGADLAHAHPIVAIDISDERLEYARSFGATHVVNAGREDVIARVRELTGGGPDHTFECVGNPRTLEQLIEIIPASGNGYIVGAAPPGTRFPFLTDGFLRDKHLHGVTLGSVRASIDIPRYIELYARGRLPLDRLVTRRYRLEEINDAIADLERGAGRGVLVFD